MQIAGNYFFILQVFLCETQLSVLLDSKCIKLESNLHLLDVLSRKGPHRSSIRLSVLLKQIRNIDNKKTFL